jgi:hypothetical protein
MNKNKCVFFTYLGKETKFITKLSENTNISVGTPHSSYPSSISSSQQRSLAASICVSLPKRPFGAPASETTSAGHAYQLRHLTNGEANQRAELGIKEASFPSSSISSPDQFTRPVTRLVHRISSAVHTNTSQADTSEQSTLRCIKKEETTSSRPATMPRGLGTTAPSRAC